MNQNFDEEQQFLQELFGNGGRNYKPRARRNDSVVPYSVTLDDLYKGKKAKLKVSKNVLCGECEGIGGRSGASTGKCESCDGIGEVLLMRRVGPMYEQMRSQCPNCYGKGKIIAEEDKCKKCDGKMVVPSEGFVSVTIKPGMRNGEKIIFYGEGDQEPGGISDLILVLEAMPHEIFERRDNDLFTEKEITLNEALCGYSAVIKHLCGRKLHLTTDPGYVIEPDSWHTIMRRGMPVVNSKKRGNLHIRFTVRFPENLHLSGDQYKKLESLLPPRPALKFPNKDRSKEVSLSEFDRHRYTDQQHEGIQGDSDDEEEQHHGRPQSCRPM